MDVQSCMYKVDELHKTGNDNPTIETNLVEKGLRDQQNSGISREEATRPHKIPRVCQAALICRVNFRGIRERNH